MDDKNILELHVEQQDTDGTAKRAAEYHKRLIHQTSIVLREGIPEVPCWSVWRRTMVL